MITTVTGSLQYKRKKKRKSKGKHMFQLYGKIRCCKMMRGSVKCTSNVGKHLRSRWHGDVPRQSISQAHPSVAAAIMFHRNECCLLIVLKKIQK